MKNIVVFLYKTKSKKSEKYLSLLNNKENSFTVKSFNSLSNEEKKHCEVAIVLEASKEELSLLPNLKWVQSLKAGVETLLEELQESKIEILRLIDPQLSYSMASSVLAWVYYVQKNMNQYKLQQKQQNWQEIPEKENKDTNIAILGLGTLGLRCANKLLENDFKISGWARSKKDVKNITMYYEEEGLNDILKTADIIVCLLPLSKDTYKLLNTQKIALFKNNCSFINFGRGAIVDYDALEKSIDKRAVNHAILDVFDKEPLDKKSSLWQNENITVLPHVSAITNANTASRIAQNNVNNYFMKEELPVFVDKKLGY